MAFGKGFHSCKISSSHGGEYDVQNCLLGCTALSNDCRPTFQRCVLSPSSGMCIHLTLSYFTLTLSSTFNRPRTVIGLFPSLSSLTPTGHPGPGLLYNRDPFALGSLTPDDGGSTSQKTILNIGFTVVQMALMATPLFPVLAYHRSGRWYNQFARTKRRSTSRRLHGSTSQKGITFTPAAVRTWTLTKQSLDMHYNRTAWGAPQHIHGTACGLGQEVDKPAHSSVQKIRFHANMLLSIVRRHLEYSWCWPHCPALRVCMPRWCVWRAVS
jgi:hypothetical protein